MRCVQLQRLAYLGDEQVHVGRAAQNHRLLQQKKAVVVLLHLHLVTSFLLLIPPTWQGPLARAPAAVRASLAARLASGSAGHGWGRSELEARARLGVGLA